MDLYNILLQIHSAGRWVLILLLLIAIFNSMVAGGRPYIKSDARTGLILVSTADIMLLIGFYLWYAGSWGYKQIEAMGFSAVMKDPVARFFAVEHMAGMLISVILIHIGKIQGRKKIADRTKHKRTFLYYIIALLVILISIPWPFRQAGAGRGWY